MPARPSVRPSYANVASTLALFVALSTGTVYAANEWNGSNIQDGTLTGADVQNGSLDGNDILGNSLSGALIFDGSLTAADLGTGSVGSSEIADNIVSAADLVGTVSTTRISPAVRSSHRYRGRACGYVRRSPSMPATPRQREVLL